MRNVGISICVSILVLACVSPMLAEKTNSEVEDQDQSGQKTAKTSEELGSNSDESACPCWTWQELESLPTPSMGGMWKSRVDEVTKTYGKHIYWDGRCFPGTVTRIQDEQSTRMDCFEDKSFVVVVSLGESCSSSSGVSRGGCCNLICEPLVPGPSACNPKFKRYVPGLTTEQHAACEELIRRAGAKKGVEGFGTSGTDSERSTGMPKQ